MLPFNIFWIFNIFFKVYSGGIIDDEVYNPRVSNCHFSMHQACLMLSALVCGAMMVVEVYKELLMMTESYIAIRLSLVSPWQSSLLP